MTVYTQSIKNSARNIVLSEAIRKLTCDRNSSSCVRNSYVREVTEYLKRDEGSQNAVEANKINYDYICSWEDLHRSFVGNKKPNELTICYLAGPEPNNDFDELIKHGIHPHNIWAFESDKSTFKQITKRYQDKIYNIPKITNRSIEAFFQYTPKKFDIVYLDCCGAAFPSSKHTLRTVATLLKYDRLNSPGIIITNFSEPTPAQEANFEFIRDEIMFRHCSLTNMKKLGYPELLEDIKKEFSHYYGNYITRSLFDLVSLGAPALRFVNSDYWSLLSKDNPKQRNYTENVSVETTVNNSILFNSIKRDTRAKALTKKTDFSLFKEFEGREAYGINLFDSLKYIQRLKSQQLNLSENMNEIINFLKNGNHLFNFLDQPNYELYIDLFINQLSYPMHYNVGSTQRYIYKAKTNKMHLDLLVLDNCRYIYEWMSTIDFCTKSIKNKSWQYIYRFALDGLVKQRIKYNDEYFYRGSVIGKDIEPFCCKTLTMRETII